MNIYVKILRRLITMLLKFLLAMDRMKIILTVLGLILVALHNHSVTGGKYRANIFVVKGNV